MSYGTATKVVSGAASALVNFIKPSGPHYSCDKVFLHNTGSVTVYFHYNSDDDATVNTGIELAPGEKVILEGGGGEQIKTLRHITAGAAGEFKWSRL